MNIALLDRHNEWQTVVTNQTEEEFRKDRSTLADGGRIVGFINVDNLLAQWSANSKPASQLFLGLMNLEAAGIPLVDVLGGVLDKVFEEGVRVGKDRH